MTRYETEVQQFDSVLGVDLTLGVLNAQTFALNSFGPEQTGVFQSNSGVFATGDDTITFNGEPVEYIGSGEAQFGIETGGFLGGLLKPVTDLVFDTVSDPAPVTVFKAGGETFVIFPEGKPETLLGLESVLIRFDLTADPVTIPCFAAGTLILTPKGEVPIEDLAPGDLVRDIDGIDHEVIWVGNRTVHFSVPHPEIQNMRPVRIPAGAFGPDRPSRDLIVSPRHLLLRDGADVEVIADLNRAFCKAAHLVGDLAHLDTSLPQIQYHHILCRSHVVLVANGLPAESLRLGHRMIDDVFSAADLDRLRASFPDLLGDLPSGEMPCAYPVLRAYEARAL